MKVANFKNASATSILTYAKNLLGQSTTMDGRHVFIPTTDAEFFPHTPKEALNKLAKEADGDAKAVLIGFNHNEGSFAVAEHEMVPDNAHPMDALDSMHFAKAVKKVAPETHTPGVMDLVKREYSHSHKHSQSHSVQNGPILDGLILNQ